MSFMQSIKELEQRASESGRVGSLNDQIEAMQAQIKDLEAGIEERDDEIAELRDELDEVKEACYTLRTQVPDLRRDPDPYGLHGVPLSHRLAAIGFPEM